MYEVNIKWVGKQQYVAEGHEGRHAVVLDIAEKHGGSDTGMHATELMLISVGMCSAVDVVRIMGKKRTNLNSLQVTVTGEISQQLPKYFEKIHIKYTASGDGVTAEKVGQAVHLSHEKYCIVANSLSRKCAITTSVEIQ
jgi:putative redox protein